MEIQLKILGILYIALAALHMLFPKYFNWIEELKPLSMINRQMMQVHTFFIGLTVLGMGLLNIFCSEDLIGTKLGRTLCFGLFVFWELRLAFQFFVYSNELWKGKKFETAIHVLCSFLWTYCTIVYFMIWRQ